MFFLFPTFRVLPYSSYSHTINRRILPAWSKAEGNEASQVIGNIGGSGQSRWIWSKASIPDSLKHSQTQVNDTNNCSHWIRRQWSKGAGHTQSLTSTRLREDCSVPRYVCAEEKKICGLVMISPTHRWIVVKVTSRERCVTGYFVNPSTAFRFSHGTAAKNSSGIDLLVHLHLYLKNWPHFHSPNPLSTVLIILQNIFCVCWT
jgi:hypothetical protein